MATTAKRSLFDALALIPDHRHKQGNRHPLQAVLAMSVAATLSGYSTLSAISQWGREMFKNHRTWMRSLGFDSFTSPTVSTLHEIFRAIDIDSVEKIIAAWIDGLLGQNTWRAISIDGKPFVLRDANCQIRVETSPCGSSMLVRGISAAFSKIHWIFFT